MATENKIFTKYIVQKKDLFDTLINHMKSVGWVRLNEGHATSGNNYWVMHSMGKSGDTPIYICLSPFDGNNAIGSASRDIRNSGASDGLYQIGSGYDPVSGMLTGPFHYPGFETFPFFPGRYFNTNNENYWRDYNKEFEMEFYIYADLDFVVFVNVPFAYTNLQNCLTYFGKPEKSYLAEVKSPAYTNTIFGSSGKMYENRLILKILERPRNFSRNGGGYTCDIWSVINPYSPNVDGVFQLSDVYYGRSDEGIRGRIGNSFYALQPGGATDGDLIEVRVEGAIHKYRYTTLGPASDDRKAWPTYCVAFRVE